MPGRVQLPVVYHHLEENVFTLSNVPNIADLAMIAPSLAYQIFQADPTTYRITYQPTGEHRVQMKFRGTEFARFTVLNETQALLADGTPAVLEADPELSVEHTVPGSEFLLNGMTDEFKLEIVAPGLEHTVTPTDSGMLVKCKATGVHDVDIIYEGETVNKFQFRPVARTN
eukprot:494978_1